MERVTKNGTSRCGSNDIQETSRPNLNSISCFKYWGKKKNAPKKTLLLGWWICYQSVAGKDEVWWQWGPCAPVSRGHPRPGGWRSAPGGEEGGIPPRRGVAFDPQKDRILHHETDFQKLIRGKSQIKKNGISVLHSVQGLCVWWPFARQGAVGTDSTVRAATGWLNLLSHQPPFCRLYLSFPHLWVGSDGEGRCKTIPDTHLGKLSKYSEQRAFGGGWQSVKMLPYPEGILRLAALEKNLRKSCGKCGKMRKLCGNYAVILKGEETTKKNRPGKGGGKQKIVIISLIKGEKSFALNLEIMNKCLKIFYFSEKEFSPIRHKKRPTICKFPSLDKIERAERLTKFKS